MTLKDKIEQIDLDKIVDSASRVKVQAFINKVEATAEASPDDAMNLIDGLIGKLSLSNPQALRTKISKAEAQKKVDKIKKMKNIVPQKADIVKIKAQIAKQYPTWDDDRVEELANIRIQAQVDRADSIKKMIDNLEKTNLYAGKVSNAPIDYVAPKDPSRVMRNRNLPKDAKTSAVTEAEELRSTGRKFKRKSPTYGKAGGAKRPYYYEYRMNRRDVDSKIQLAKGGYADPENNTHVLHIDGQNWYLEKIDSTHFYMSNTPEARGMAHHIGQHKGEPYYDEVRTWLKETGDKYAKGGRLDRVQFTKLATLGYRQEAPNQWRFVDLQSTEDLGSPVAVGDIYKTKKELLADLDNFAEIRGYEYAQGGKFPKRSMNIKFTDDFFEQGRGNSSMKIQEFPDPSVYLPSSSNVEQFYVGQTISYPITKSTLLDKGVKNYFNKFADRDLIIEEIVTEKPYNLAKVYDKESGEKISGHVVLNPKRLSKYAKGGEIKPFEYTENGATIYVNGFKADVKAMYLDYVNNFLTVGAFADYYGISDEQAQKIIESGREYLKEDGHYAKGGEVSIPNADKMMHLPMEVAVYVPSTSNVDKEISATEMKARVKEVETYLAELFGGFTSSEKVGGYLSGKSGVITEKVVPVTAFATNESFAKNKNKLVNKLAVWAKKWSQEAMGLEFEGDLYYVPQKFKKGGRLTATYIPNEDIESIKTRFGQTFSGKDILDGAYVKRKVKTPKVSRYMFEEEAYEYADGGVFEEGNQVQGKMSGNIIDAKGVMYFVGMKIGEIDGSNDVYEIFRAGSLHPMRMSENKMREFGNKFADGGSVSPTGGQFMIDYCWSDVYVDDYEQGEMESKGTREHDFMVGEIFDFEDLFDILDNNLGLSTDPSHYTIVDGKILTSRLEDADGDEPTKYEIESWKEGKITLYSVHYTIGLKMVVVSELNDEMLSSITKINIE